MYPLRLNLLSNDRKRMLGRIIVFQFIRSTLLGVLLALCLTGTFLLGSEFVLQKHFNQLADSISSVNSGYAEMSRKINEINATVLQAQQIQKEYRSWTPLLATIANAIPNDIALLELSIDQSAGTVQLAGMAKTRESLLALQESLLAIDCTIVCVKSAPIPPSQLTQKENIRFSIEAALQ